MLHFMVTGSSWELCFSLLKGSTRNHRFSRLTSKQQAGRNPLCLKALGVSIIVTDATQKLGRLGNWSSEKYGFRYAFFCIQTLKTWKSTFAKETLTQCLVVELVQLNIFGDSKTDDKLHCSLMSLVMKLNIRRNSKLDMLKNRECRALELQECIKK